MIRTYTLDFNQKEELNALADTLIDHPKKQILIQIFTQYTEEKDLFEISEEIKAIFPLVSIAGSTSYQNIMNGVPSDIKTLIAITTFDDTRVELLHLPFNSNVGYLVEKLDESFGKRNQEVFFIHSSLKTSQDYTNQNILLDYMDKKWTNAKFAGAAAANTEINYDTFVFSEYGLIESGLVLVGLSGKSLKAETDYHISWKPTGKKLTVTKVDGKRLYSLDGNTPVEIYEKYFGKDVAGKLPFSAFNFPLMHESYSEAAVVALSKTYKDGSVELSRALHVGDQLKMGHFHGDLFIKDAKDMYNRFKDKDVQSLFVFSCASRHRTIGDDVEIEMVKLRDFGPVTGLFGFGETFKGEGRANQLSQTLTVIGLSEGDGEKVDSSNLIFDIEYSDRFEVLNQLRNFNAVSISELEKENEELKKLAMKDPLTNLFNRRYFDMQLAYEIKRHTRAGNFLTLIMFDIDYFKRFNDTYGHVLGDDCLRGIGQAVNDTVKREADLCCRIGGEEFAIILPETNQKGGLVVAENLRKIIEDLKIPHESSDASDVVTASFGMITVKLKDFVNRENIIKLCDELLYQAKNDGRNRVAYDLIEF